MSCNNTNLADLRPVQYNVQIWRNDTWSQVFRILSNNEPVDLTGCTILIQIRKKANATTSEMSLSTTDNSISIGGEFNNQITLDKIVNIAAGSYVYDMNITFPNSHVKTYLWGSFYVQEDITKA